jgi:phosphoribosylformylglycinamidine synthase II
VEPERLDDAREVCSRWGLASAVVGRLVDGGALRVVMGDAVVADVPARSLAEEGPEYRRPMSPQAELDDRLGDDPTFAVPSTSAQDALFSVLASPNVASKRWVWEQYDWIVQGGTVRGPGSDAAVVRIEGGLKALAISSDGKGRFGALDPYLGAAHAVAEAARNVAATGAKPIAITNCLNFGSPERPAVMWQFAESVRGMADACRAFETPVTGGNVSFYNESAGSAIWPTPVVGMVGLLEDHRLAIPSGFARPGDLVVLLGETFPELGGSEFAEVVLGRVAGRPPALDLGRERALHRLLVEGASLDILASAHDCGDGGLGIALAEAAIIGGIGFAVTLPGDLPPHVALFSESASRAVVSVDPGRAEHLGELASALGVPFVLIGETGGPRVVIDRMLETTVGDLTAVYEGALPALLAS